MTKVLSYQRRRRSNSSCCHFRSPWQLCSLLLFFLVTVVLSSSFLRAAESPSCAVDDDCPRSSSSDNADADSSSSGSSHDSLSWFEDASNDGLKFLQEHVFGQKQKTKKRRGWRQRDNDNNYHGSDEEDLLLERRDSFSHLFHGAVPANAYGSNSGTRLNNDDDDDDLSDDDDDSRTGNNSLDEAKTSGGAWSTTTSSSSSGTGILSTLKEILSSDRPDEAFFQLLLSRSSSSSAGQDDGGSGTGPSFQDTAQLFLNHVTEISDQLQRTFGDRLDALVSEFFFMPSAWYLLRKEQETKHAYWKTSQHRNMEKLTDTNVFRELHQALYLSDLAYVDSEPQVREGLTRVDHGAWELLFVDTKGNPSEPAHFLAVEKQPEPLRKHKSKNSNKNSNDNSHEKLFWQKMVGRKLSDLVAPPPKDDDSLKVLIVVRGTKTLADVLSDALLEATNFKGTYKAHGGIAQSGQYIVDKHIGRLSKLLEASGRSKIQLLLFGHSLGCGTAAIAAMEFHDTYKDFISVRSVGFGCPSLVSPELSEQYKDIITTVITDADVVPRMSGASMVNLQLEMMSLDWTDYLLEELEELAADIIADTSSWAGDLAKNLLDKLGAAIEKSIKTDVKPAIEKAVQEAIPKAIKTPNQRLENELIPPGTCLHLYRTATGFDAAYTPCSFFHEIEFVPHLVDDHMTKTGYHFALLSLLRQQLQDYNAVFESELPR